MHDDPFDPYDFIHAHRPGRGPDSSGAPRPEFDLRVFTQSEYWKDDTGVVFVVADLDWRDRRALRAWLYRNAQHFYVQVLARELISSMRLTPGFVPRLTHQSAKEWMRDTELMAALDTGLVARLHRWWERTA